MHNLLRTRSSTVEWPTAEVQRGSHKLPRRNRLVRGSTPLVSFPLFCIPTLPLPSLPSPTPTTLPFFFFINLLLTTPPRPLNPNRVLFPLVTQSCVASAWSERLARHTMYVLAAALPLRACPQCCSEARLQCNAQCSPYPRLRARRPPPPPG